MGFIKLWQRIPNSHQFGACEILHYEGDGYLPSVRSRGNNFRFLKAMKIAVGLVRLRYGLCITKERSD